MDDYSNDYVRQICLAFIADTVQHNDFCKILHVRCCYCTLIINLLYNMLYVCVCLQSIMITLLSTSTARISIQYVDCVEDTQIDEQQRLIKLCTRAGLNLNTVISRNTLSVNR
jgi:hypothetical protein